MQELTKCWWFRPPEKSVTTLKLWEEVTNEGRRNGHARKKQWM